MSIRGFILWCNIASYSRVVVGVMVISFAIQETQTYILQRVGSGQSVVLPPQVGPPRNIMQSSATWLAWEAASSNLFDIKVLHTGVVNPVLFDSSA